jgi:hypothetical protein
VKVIHAARWNGIKCLTPKSPDEPVRHVRNERGGNRGFRFHIEGDEFPKDNRMGMYEIYYGLRDWVFCPGMVILELRDSYGKVVNRRWHVMIRHSKTQGNQLDAWAELQDGSVLWLRIDRLCGLH